MCGPKRWHMFHPILIRFSTTVSLRIPARNRSPKFEKGFTRPGVCWIRTCMRNVGLGDLEPTKGHHFPPGPYAEYKSTVSQKDIASKQTELKVEANALISRRGKISAALLPYGEACKLCGDCLTDCIAKHLWSLAGQHSSHCEARGQYWLPVWWYPCFCYIRDQEYYGGSHVSVMSEIKSLWLLKYGHRKDRQRSFRAAPPEPFFPSTQSKN